MHISIKKFDFPKKLLKTGLCANDKWRQVPSLDMLHQNVHSEIMLIVSGIVNQYMVDVRPLRLIFPLHWKYGSNFTGKDTW